MNLAMVRLYCGESGRLSYYNMQELGFAKAIAKCGIRVFILFLNHESREIQEEYISKNITIVHVPAKKIFNHGFFNTNLLLEYQIDVVHLQSDNQIYAPHVMKFCKNKDIKCYNYVGTFYTDSSNVIKRKVMNFVSNRNAKYFKKFTTFVKTPVVQKQLQLKGVEAKVIPVGLDIDIIPDIKESKEELRVKLGFPGDKKILIFVGRLETYKKPFDAIELIKSLNNEYILIMIGKGSLKDAIFEKIKQYDIEEKIRYFEAVPNKEIHEYYKLSDFFMNFNDKEIFGMSILEAMYQECVVIAKDAPGPSFIIENGISGYIVNDLEDMTSLANHLPSEIGRNARNRIITKFNWNAAATVIYHTSIVEQSKEIYSDDNFI